MYKRFAFEGEVHSSLSCVPLTVRRKLDLAGVKISLAGWQTLSREERLALCHLPVDSAEELGVYREVLVGFCQRQGVGWTPVADAIVAARAWNARSVPAPLRDRIQDEAWADLDEESRYALLKLTQGGRDPAKLDAALAELGLAAAGAR
jgi:hypothetical protein